MRKACPQACTQGPKFQGPQDLEYLGPQGLMCLCQERHQLQQLRCLTGLSRHLVRLQLLHAHVWVALTLSCCVRSHKTRSFD